MSGYGILSGKQEFSYQKVKDGICILRCYGENGRVTVPAQLEGMPVTELSDYAFAEEMEEEPAYTGELACICGGRLEELYLPRTIQRLGRYVFYNCIRLHKLSFYSNLAFMGAGGFTGCEGLSHLVMHQMEGTSCLREILQDLKQAVTVECVPVTEISNPKQRPETGKDTPLWQLVFPEFFEEAVENTPARIISTQTHGMGIQYRNTFRNTQIVFSEYDKLFETGKYNIDFINILNMAVSRLMFPCCLESSARREYGGWLREHWKRAAFCLVEQESRKELYWMAEVFADTREEAQTLIQAANAGKDAEAVSRLMDIFHRRFPQKKRHFSL